MTEYGLFNDEGLVEAGFYSVEEAKAAITDRYDAGDELEIEEVCPYHQEHARCGCEECDNEERADEEWADIEYADELELDDEE